MFTVAERSQVREALTRAAHDDHRIAAAAIVGSGARGQEDRWSDIDLALRLSPGQDVDQVVQSWTASMYRTRDAVAHTDVWSGSTLYRVFLLASSLQVDISFWRDEEFRPRGGPFKLLFGEGRQPEQQDARSPQPFVGMGWLYALHARSSIARGRGIQALLMLNGMRDQVISLLCLREGLDPDHGRGVDLLPGSVRQRLIATIARGVEREELIRAFTELTALLVGEVDQTSAVNPLLRVLEELVDTAAAEAP